MRRVKFQHRDRRHGMTIIELLVVLGIFAILLGIAATAVKNGTKGKKQREAARQVNSFIAAAQARAVQLNRPVGIEIRRNANDTNDDGVITPGTDSGVSNAGLIMYQIETPPPYAGDNLDSTVNVSVAAGTVTLTDTALNFGAASVLMDVGDSVEVRLNYRGPRYNATVTSLSPLTLTFGVPAYDNTVFAGAVPIQIYFRPVRSSVTPLQLPTDMCIDFSCSGMGSTGNEFANWSVYNALNSAANPIDGDEAVKFTFSPRGTIHRVYPDGDTEMYPNGNIHLLVGKYEYAVNATEVMGTNGLNDVTSFPTGTPVSYDAYLTSTDTPTNLADGTAMWVSINYRTGQVTTTRNKYITDPSSYGFTTSAGSAARNAEILSITREFASSVLTIQGEGNE
ncbi:type II secretion system protein [Bremerella cremea]|uniref:type II secretion system protein n=1 Tax=Bremerella cremea TaxID=1031537 RepID=UPI0031EB939D